MKKGWRIGIATGFLMICGLSVRVCNTEQQPATAEAGIKEVIPGGYPVGIYLETEGVLVLGTDEIKNHDGMYLSPSKNIIKKGDYIVAINEQPIADKKELMNALKEVEQKDVVLTVKRENTEMKVQVHPVCTEEGEYKLGIWVRDDAQGLGTITYLTGDHRFGALGHGIYDMDTNELLDVSQGTLYVTSIRHIEKGTNGHPGGMEGMIIYRTRNVVGKITENTELGIYGTLDHVEAIFKEQKKMEIARANEVKKGRAKLRCYVEGEVKEYDIMIRELHPYKRERNKTIEIQVTDSKLLQLTGGIIQGMSGSPIIQDGKIIGAVTHVFVNDPTRGYGIFIEEMLTE